MMKIKPSDLRLAAHFATEIELLEVVRDEAQDTPVSVPVSTRGNAGNPLGIHIDYTVPATAIRYELHAKLAPLYAELHALGFELDR
jgi:hypothetical protein